MKRIFRKVTGVALALALVLTPTSVSLASEASWQEQIDLLNILFDLDVEMLASNSLVLERFQHLPRIPNIVAIGTPELEGQPFFIGTEFEPSDAEVEFITTFTGIPRENTLIGQFSFEYEGILQENIELDDYGFYVNFLANSYPYLVDFDPHQITGGVVRMGQMINGPGGTLTLGHPNNASGSAFFTSPHGNWSNGTRVNMGETGTIQMGQVSRNGFGPPTGADFAQVNVFGFGTEVSRQVPWANRNITNFRGVAHAGDSARSIRGRSGVRSVTVEQAGFSWDHSPGRRMTNWILVYPNVSQGGDSGSALIRTNGTTETVLGSRFGTITLGGRVFGAYSPATSYN